MGLTVSVNTSVLQAFAASLQERVDTVRKDIAGKIQVDWAAGVLAHEKGIDTPEGREDYDTNLAVAEDGPNRSVVFATVDWAPKQEYGDVKTPGDGGQARQAAEAHRQSFTDAITASVQP